MTDLKSSMDVSMGGLLAQAGRLSNVAQNIANADTPGYKRKLTSFTQTMEANDAPSVVALAPTRRDSSQGQLIYDPEHPLAGSDGTYEGSNVSLLVEIADAREAQRTYEANLRSFDNARQMSRSLLELLRR